MPLPRGLARLNRVLANRITRPAAARLPGFGVIVHRGRRTGRTYRTPVNCFVRGDRIVVALTYGPDVDWLKNLRAGGGGEVVMGGRARRVGPPETLGEQAMGLMPGPVRLALRALGVDRFVALPLVRPDQTT